MKTGIILEINGQQALLLKNDGTFLSVPIQPGWQQGDTVALPSPPRRQIRPFAALAACILLAVTLGGSGWQLYFTQTALVSIDVNPSIELSLNRFDRVIAMTARNDEGAAILAQAALRNRSGEDAVTTLLSAAEMSTYLAENADVVVTVFADDRAQQKTLQEQLQRSATATVTAHHPTVAVECHSVNAAIVADAHAHQVTAGKYLYLEQLQAEDPTIDITQYTTQSIGQIKTQIEQCHQAHGQTSNNSSVNDSFENDSGETCPNNRERQDGEGHRHRHGQRNTD